MWIPDALIIVFAANLFAAQPTYTLHLDQAVLDTKGHPQYIRDAEIAAKVHGFAHLGARVGTCFQSMTAPNRLYITYPPTVVGPHEARTNVLNCESTKDSTQFACQVSDSESVVFGDTASKYFVLGQDTPIAEAAEIFNAYNRSSVRFKKGVEPWIKTFYVTAIKKIGSYFILQRRDCGCSNPFRVELKHENDKAVVVVSEATGGSCI